MVFIFSLIHKDFYIILPYPISCFSINNKILCELFVYFSLLINLDGVRPRIVHIHTNVGTIINITGEIITVKRKFPRK